MYENRKADEFFTISSVKEASRGSEMHEIQIYMRFVPLRDGLKPKVMSVRLRFMFVLLRDGLKPKFKSLGLQKGANFFKDPVNG